MSQIRTSVDNNGRILIPAQIRKECHIKPGDVFVMRVIDNEIRMLSLDKAIEFAQTLVRQYVPKGLSLVDELIKSRREEHTIEETQSKAQEEELDQDKS